MIINYEKKKVDIKICVVGIKGSGKTSFLKSLVQEMEIRIGAIYSPIEEACLGESKTERVSFFTFRKIRDQSEQEKKEDDQSKCDEEIKEEFLDIIITLQTIPEESKKDIFFKGVDGVIFIVDRRISRIHNNETLAIDVFGSLRKMGIRPEKIPFVFMYNFCDAKNEAVSINSLNKTMNTFKAPHLLTIADKGVGVIDVIKKISDISFSRIPGEKFRAEEPQSISTKKRYSKGVKLSQHVTIQQLKADQDIKKLTSSGKRDRYRIRNRSDENVWRDLVNKAEKDLGKDK